MEIIFSSESQTLIIDESSGIKSSGILIMLFEKSLWISLSPTLVPLKQFNTLPRY
jgi:hypothetical protein